MATVIDSLVVTLGLDTGGLIKGQKNAVTSFAKTKDEFLQYGKTVESSAKTVGESIESIGRKALAMFAIFAGARSIKDFVADIGLADSALGRLAGNLNVTPQRLSAMTMAVERNGGSASAAASSFRSLSDSFEELKNTGNSGILPMLQRLQGQGGAAIDMMHGFDKALPGIVANLTALKNRGDAVGANWFGRQLGIDDETVNWLEQGWPKVQADIEKSRRLGVVTPQSAKAAQDLLQSLQALQQAAVGLGRDILVSLSPQILAALQAMDQWVQKNHAWLESGIKQAISDFSDTLRSIDWKGVAKGIADFIKGANDATSAVGGWKNVAELLLGLWVGAKFTAAIAAIGRFRSLLALPLPAWALAILGLSAPAIEGQVRRPVDGAFDALTGAPTPEQQQNRDMGVIERGKKLWGERPGWLGGAGRKRSPTGGAALGDGSLEDKGGSSAAIRHGEFREKAPGVAQRLKTDFGLTDEESAAVLGNLGHESVGFKAFNEGRGGPGRGWAQWTDPGRKARFFAYAQRNNLDPKSDEANYGFLRWELRNTHKGAISALKKANGLEGKTVAFEQVFEGAGVKNYPSRFRYAREAQDAIRNAPAVKTPPMVRVPTPTKPNAAWHGIPGAADAMGLPKQAAAGSVSSTVANDNSSRSSETHVGEINVHVANGDAHEIAKSIGPAIERHSYAVHANYGIA